MGILDFLRRKKAVAVEVKYILKRKDASGGMAKVAELAKPTPIDELYHHLEPGVYALHKYTKGQSGFEVVWGPAEVVGEEGREPRREVVGAPQTGLVGLLRDFKKLKEDAKEEFELLKELFEGKTVTEEDIEKSLDSLEARYKRLGKIFGKEVSGTEEPIYEGKIPIYLHPKVIPELVDTTLDKAEKRLIKWGVVEEERVMEEGGEIIKLPRAKKKEKKAEGEEGVKEQG